MVDHVAGPPNEHQGAPPSRVEVRDLDEPEAVVDGPLGATNQVRLAGTVVSRHVLQPGWSWEEHSKPLVGTASCELYHRGVVLSGRMGIRMDDGEELVVGPGQVFDLPPGHVTWVEGDEELVMVDWAGGAGFDPDADFLGAAGRASVRSELADDAQDYADAGESADAIARDLGPLPELRDAMSLVWRMLLAALAVIALFVIAGWVG